MAWVPPALRKKHTHGASVGKVQEWAKKNRTFLVAAGLVIGGLIAWSVYQRSRRVGGLSATEASTRDAPSATVAPTPAVSAETVKTPETVPSVPSAPSAPAACGDSDLPKPMNVFQDEGLAGTNDVTLGPGVAAYSASSAGVPVDYAGSCSGVNPAAVWQSSQLLPAACGQSLEGTSDWNIYAPSNYQVTSFLAAGQNFGQDTVSTTLKNASLDLRPEPSIPQAGCSQVPFGQSSWVDNGVNRVDYSHSLVA